MLINAILPPYSQNKAESAPGLLLQDFESLQQDFILLRVERAEGPVLHF